MKVDQRRHATVVRALDRHCFRLTTFKCHKIPSCLFLAATALSVAKPDVKGL